MSEYTQIPPFTSERPEKGVRVTIEWADPNLPPVVLAFDEVQINQSRPVTTRYEDDKPVEFIPDPTTTTVITGTRTVPAA